MSLFGGLRQRNHLTLPVSLQAIVCILAQATTPRRRVVKRLGGVMFCQAMAWNSSSGVSALLVEQLVEHDARRHAQIQRIAAPDHGQADDVIADGQQVLR